MPGGRPPRARQGDPRRGWIVAGAVAVLVVLGGLAAAVAPDDAEGGQPAAVATPSPSVPPYRIVGTDKGGLSADITVEVDSTQGLRQVFDAVRKRYRKNGGYFVIINCSTGGTAGTAGRDQRLANGRYAIGHEGAAATGLADGKAEFEVLPDAECPA